MSITTTFDWSFLFWSCCANHGQTQKKMTNDMMTA